MCVCVYLLAYVYVYVDTTYTHICMSTYISNAESKIIDTRAFPLGFY